MSESQLPRLQTGGSNAVPSKKALAEPRSWVALGIASGLIGAALVALFFLAFDLAAGRPLWTPGALGAALLGEPIRAGEVPSLAVVAGYTVLHGSVFVIVGLMASFALEGHRRRLGPAAGIAVALALFAAFEVILLAFAALMAPGLIGEFGAGEVAVANLVAAIAMSAVLVRIPRSARPRPGDDAPGA